MRFLNNNKDSNLLRVGGIEYHNKTSAPWTSTELFVSGCYKNCPNCFNQELRDFNYGRLLPVKFLAEQIIKNVPYKKVTFSGGEPFLQALQLSKLAKLLRNKGFIIVCYSGYTAEELPYLFSDAKELLYNIDILVDGPFIKELLTPIDCDYKFVGSKNQRIIDIQSSLDNEKIILWTEEQTKILLKEG